MVKVKDDKAADDLDEEVLEKEFGILGYLVVIILILAVVYAMVKSPIKGHRPGTIGSNGDTTGYLYQQKIRDVRTLPL